MPRLLALFVVGSLTLAAGAEDWIRFRGANGTGIVSEAERKAGVPTFETAPRKVFDLTLPGKGHSSPIVLGDRLFITAGIEQEGRDGGAIRYLLCLDANTGEEKWRAGLGFAPSHKHKKNSYASATPTTDGERVYVAFADEQKYLLSAYTLDGEDVWTADLGTFSSQHGHGVSPIVYDGKVILPNDQQGPSTVSAFDAKTGEKLWDADRNFRRTSYATPMVLTGDDGKTQIITVSGAMGITSLDPQTGKTNWSSGELLMRTVASPVLADGVLIASCGSGGSGKQMVAVKPDLTLSEGVNRIAWETRRLIPYVPTPVAIGDKLYLWNDNGVVRCLEAKTGEEAWTERVGGNFSGSPIAVGNLLYCISEAGELVVLDVSEGAKIVSRTPLGDASHATPVVANGKLYLRTFNKLLCFQADS